MKRRTFIQRLAGTGIVLPMALGFPRVRAFAKSPSGSPFMRLMSASSDRAMVIIRLAGGNDGLNTVVPYTNSDYYTARKQGTADDLSIAANTVVKLGGSSTMGLHPSLAPLQALWDQKKMAIVQNVGYPNQNLSHFRSTDIWLSGSDSTVYQNSGWYARYLEELYPDYPGVLPTDPFAIELGTYLSTMLIGDSNNMGVAVADLSYIPGQPDSDPVAATNAGAEEEYVKQIAIQSNKFSNSIIAAGLKQLTNKVTYPTSALATGLASISRLLAGGLKTQLFIINVGGYDTHTNQLASQAKLHADFAASVAAFQSDLEAFGLDKRVSLMTISEFGRRAACNGTGTDHGSAAPMFVFGSSVNGGFYGNDPNLSDLEAPGNLKMQYDFRQIYASVLGGWYGAPENQITPVALPHHFDQLPIFQAEVSGIFANNDIAGGLQLGQNYPNPAVSATTIPIGGLVGGANAELSLYSTEGKQILSRQVIPGETSVTINTTSLPAGTYVYEISAGNTRRSRKMVVEH